MTSLIMAAKGVGVKKIIFVSSISVLENHQEASNGFGIPDSEILYLSV